MKNGYFFPQGDHKRLAWVINFNNKLLSGYAATLGLTPVQLAYILNGIKVMTYILSCVVAAERFYHTCVSFKENMSVSTIGTELQAIPVYIAIPGAPTVFVPFGFYSWILDLVASIKTNGAYTTEMGVDLDIIGSASLIDWSTAQPIKVKAKLSGGFVNGSYLKGQADGARIESKRGTETAFTTLTNVSKASFIDSRPNLVVGQPETRQYRLWYLKKDVVVGLVSVIVTITVNN